MNAIVEYLVCALLLAGGGFALVGSFALAKLSRFELRGCAIYSSCEPCPMCLSAIYWARLDALYFAAAKDDAAEAGFDDHYIYEQIPLPWNTRALQTARLLAGEGLAPFDAWRATPGRIPY